MPLFRKAKDEDGIVVGRIRGEELDLLRVSKASGHLHLRGAATVPWESGSALGDPLERLLGWRTDEPFIIAVVTPALAGGSLTIRRPPPTTEERFLRDPREHTLQAHWEAREALREEAAEFFDCALEDLGVFREDTRAWEETAAGDALETTITTVFYGPAALGGSPHTQRAPAGFHVAPPPDVPTCEIVLLPVFFSELFPPSPEPVGLLVSEETRLSFLIRHGEVLRVLRTAPLGTDLLVGTLVRALSCSPREAEMLLQHGDASALSPDALQVISRVFRPLFPVFRTALQLFVEHVPIAERPSRIIVAGLWPALLHRLLFHRNLVLVPASRPRIVQFLARPTLTPAEPSRLASARIPESVFLLLEQLAESALRRTNEAATAEIPVPAHHRQ